VALTDALNTATTALSAAPAPSEAPAA